MKKKNVVSFSLWGDKEKYFNGAIANINLVPKVYPGWVARVYVDDEYAPQDIDEMRKTGAEVFVEHRQHHWAGFFWRFKAMYDDPTIERFIVRDTDSRINGRESDAVEEWIDSDLPFHIMRDNAAHNIEIMGGMWGSKAGIIPGFKTMMDDWIAKIPNIQYSRDVPVHGIDQVFLCQKIWPFIYHCHIAHDEYFKLTGYERPFRVKLNRDGYVGMVYSDADADRCEVMA